MTLLLLVAGVSWMTLLLLVAGVSWLTFLLLVAGVTWMTLLLLVAGVSWPTFLQLPMPALLVRVHQGGMEGHLGGQRQRGERLEEGGRYCSMHLLFLPDLLLSVFLLSVFLLSFFLLSVFLLSFFLLSFFLQGSKNTEGGQVDGNGDCGHIGGFRDVSGTGLSGGGG
jgi:hypothetical protein